MGWTNPFERRSGHGSDDVVDQLQREQMTFIEPVCA
jgi:hypothetical protein